MNVSLRPLSNKYIDAAAGNLTIILRHLSPGYGHMGERGWSPNMQGYSVLFMKSSYVLDFLAGLMAFPFRFSAHPSLALLTE